jgi:hypothetical protein
MSGRGLVWRAGKVKFIAQTTQQRVRSYWDDDPLSNDKRCAGRLPTARWDINSGSLCCFHMNAIRQIGAETNRLRMIGQADG